MFLSGLETLCLGMFVWPLLIFIAGWSAVALLRQQRGDPAYPLPSRMVPPSTPDSAFTLNYYYPLPAGYAYLEKEGTPPTVVRIDDGHPLSYRLCERTLTFREAYPGAGGTGARTHEIPVQRR